MPTNDKLVRRVHPEMERFLEATNLPPLHTLSIDQIRSHFAQRLKKKESSEKNFMLDIKNFSIPSSFGDLPARLYQPSNTQEEIPVFVFFHGGGFVLGDLDTLDDFCREIADYTQCMLISVDYPLAPENRFPVAPQACYQASKWIWNNLVKNNKKLNRFFVGGSSAGGTLAAVVALMARDEKSFPLNGQILLCSLTNVDFSTQSYLECGTGYNLTTEQCKWFLSQYAQSSDDYTHPYFVPMQATDFHDLPPALILSAACDPLADDSKIYADRLQENNIPVTFKEYAGMLHSFYSLPIETLEAREDVLEKMALFMNTI